MRNNCIGQNRAIRKAYINNPSTDIVFFYTAYIEDAKKYYGNNEMIPVVTLHQNIADHYKIPSVNGGLALYNKYVENPEATGTDGKTYFGDGYHPGKLGHSIYFEALRTQLEKILYDDNKNPCETIKYVMPSKYIESSFIKTDIIDMETEVKYRNFKTADTSNALYDYYPYAMVNTQKDAVLTFNFKGRSIQPIIKFGSDTNGIMSITIDGELINNNFKTNYSDTVRGVRYGTFPTGIINAPDNGKDIHTAVITILSEAETVTLGGFAVEDTQNKISVDGSKVNARFFMTNNTDEATLCDIMFAFYDNETDKLKKITSFEQTLNPQTYSREYIYELTADNCGQIPNIKCFLWKNKNSMFPLNCEIDING